MFFADKHLTIQLLVYNPQGISHRLQVDSVGASKTAEVGPDAL